MHIASTRAGRRCSLPLIAIQEARLALWKSLGLLHDPSRFLPRAPPCPAQGLAPGQLTAHENVLVRGFGKVISEFTMVGVNVRGGGWCVAAATVLVVLCPAACGIPRNSLSLVAPNGTRISWWTRGSPGPWQPQNLWEPLGRLPLKVKITAKIKNASRRKRPQNPDTYTAVAAGAAPGNNTVNATATSTAAGTGSGSCTTCGTSIISGNRGHNQVGWLPHKGNKPTVTVWPWSVSKNGRVNVTTVEKGIPNTNSFLIYFGRSPPLALSGPEPLTRAR